MNKDSRIVVFGGSGLLGSAILRVLRKRRYNNILSPTRNEVNLLKKKEIEFFLQREEPEYIFMVAGLVGGILANKSFPADFLFVNSYMILNLLEAIRKSALNPKLFYAGSTCIYPKDCPQPIKEEYLLTGRLEETNKGYALAKILGVVGCELYRKQYGLNAITAMPTNLYGPNDNYDPDRSHMLAALLRKFVLAKIKKRSKVVLWGSGNPRREALYSDDAADAIVYLMQNYSGMSHVNIGTGFDYSIKQIAQIYREEVCWDGEIIWDKSKPDGVFQKNTDITLLKTIYPDFKPRSLREGVRCLLQNRSEINRIIKQY